MQSYTILIVDDDPLQRELYKSWLKMADTPYEVHEAASIPEAVEQYQTHTIDCVLLDFIIKNNDGFDFLEAVKKTSGTQPETIFLTGYADSEIEEKATRHGAKGFINKRHLDGDILVESIMKVLADT